MGDGRHRVLRRALEHSIDWLDGLEERDVGATASLADLRSRLDRPLDDSGVPAEQVIDELVAGVDGGLMATGGPRFFSWAIGGALPVSVAADWLATGWDQNTVIQGTSPAMAVVEEVAGGWLKDVLRLPPDASFAFVTGCQGAHVTALAAARHKLLADLGHDVERKGLAAAPRITVRTGELCHESISRAARLIGLGGDAVIGHPCLEDGRTDLDDVARHLDDGPTVLVLQAGEFHTGAFDDFRRAKELARDRPLWIHVDGALGLWAAASDRHRHLMDGCDRLDSWATDGHKWLNVPFDCGYAFVADARAHREALTVRTDYFTAADEVRHPIDWNPEWSRRSRALPTYAVLRSLGRRGLATMIDRSCELTERLVDGLGHLDGCEVLVRPQINQGLVRFTAADGDHDRRTDEVVERVQRDGVAWFGASTFKGMRVVRTPVLNFRTTQDDIDRAIDAVRSALAAG